MLPRNQKIGIVKKIPRLSEIFFTKLLKLFLFRREIGGKKQMFFPPYSILTSIILISILFIFV